MISCISQILFYSVILFYQATVLCYTIISLFAALCTLLNLDTEARIIIPEKTKFLFWVITKTKDTSMTMCWFRTHEDMSATITISMK